MMITSINLEDVINLVDRPWSPIEVARVNDQVVRLVMVKEGYHWHKHSSEDELFNVLKGSITIEVKDQPDIILREKEMVVIPKGIEHHPKSTTPSYILPFEPLVLKSRGD